MREILAEQIIICILFSLPVPLILFANGGHAILIAYVSVFLIPIVVFFFAFGAMKNEKGCGFKIMRIIIAAFLWGLSCIGLLIFHENFIINFLLHGYWERREWMPTALIAVYIATAIAMVVILSYVIGKWVILIVNAIGKWLNSKINGKPSE